MTIDRNIDEGEVRAGKVQSLTGAQPVTEFDRGINKFTWLMIYFVAIIAPLLFSTLVVGIAGHSNLRQIGRMGIKALIYFEVLTTIALIVGLIVVNGLQPGVGMNVDVKSIDTKAIQGFVVKSKEQSTLQFLMDIIPNTVVGAFAQGEILQVLFFAILFAFGLQALGERGKVLLGVIDQATKADVFWKR